MKNVVRFTLGAMLLLTSCNKKSKEEMIIGEWRIAKVEVKDKTIANKEILEYVNNQENKEKSDYRIRFDSDRRYREFINGRESNKEDKMKFRLLDEN